VCHRGHPARRDHQSSSATESQTSAEPSPCACPESKSRVSTEVPTTIATRTDATAGLGHAVQGRRIGRQAGAPNDGRACYKELLDRGGNACYTAC